MRVLHVVPTYLPATRYGGPIHAVHGLCRALVRNGIQVEVVTTNVDGPSDSRVPLDHPATLDGVEVHYFRSPIGRRIYWSPNMRHFLRHAAGTFDLLHLHSVFLFPTLTAARAAGHAGVPYVLSPRGMLVPELVRGKSAVPKRLWIELFEKRTLRDAAAVHFTSAREKSDFDRMGLPLSRSYFVVPNGIDPPVPRPEGPRSGIVCLGRINWKKRLERVIEALPAVAGVGLTIAGNDEERLTASLESLAARLGVRDRVRFAGAVNAKEKYDLLASAAVLVLPSLSENFGNVVLEAMASGCPVVVTPEVGAAPIVEAAQCGRVVSGNPAALAGAINEIVSDPGEAAEMGRRGRAAVEREFTWDAVAGRMRDCYERILLS
jgi:glycosyltransferase involved in cell wall biosynthesis